jgi:hypothetical protein
MSKKLWLASPAKSKKPNVPESTNQQLKVKAEILVESLKQLHIKPATTTHDYNYIAEIYCKWYRNSFYFCATYNCPSSNAIAPSFETKFARMEYVSFDSFNLSYMRHTGQWFEVFQNLTSDECLKLIQNDPIFTP